MMMRRTSSIKTQPTVFVKNKPFEGSIAAIIVQRCQKLTNELHRGNIKGATALVSTLDKDLQLLHPSHTDYSRLQSLAYNTKAGYHRKMGNNEQALKLIDEAIACERTGHVDAIDRARTLLNKSVLMGQMAREDSSNRNGDLRGAKSTDIGHQMTEDRYQEGSRQEKHKLNQSLSVSVSNLYSHEAAIQLAKEALQLIKNRPENKQLVSKDQYKLGELIIISFHNIATELICLNNEKEAYNLYKKAYQIALRIMGPRHNLTQHLKTIISRHKMDKKNKNITEEAKDGIKTTKVNRRFLTEDRGKMHSMGETQHPQKSIRKQQDETQMRSKIFILGDNSKVDSKNKKKYSNVVSTGLHNIDKKKYHNFLKAYGCSKDTVNASVDKKADDEVKQKKQLKRIQKLYKPTNNNTYLPMIKRNTKDIIKESKIEQGSKKKDIISTTENLSGIGLHSSKYAENNHQQDTMEIVADIGRKVETEQREEGGGGCQLI